MPNASVPAAQHPSLDLAVWRDAEASAEIMVADGSQIRVAVRDGCLSVQDGPPGQRRQRSLPRVPRTVGRLVILGGHGYVTFEALRWCESAGVGVVQLGRDGKTLMTSPGIRGDARLRVAQAIASEARGQLSLEIMRYLIAAKISGQADVVRDVLRGDGSGLRVRAQRAARAENLDELAGHEGIAARDYWQTWKDHVFVPFPPADLAKVPAHWRRFAARASLRNPLLQGKNATDPVNALLNYAYGVCESEAARACQIMGLDPGIGFGHTAHEGGNVLAFDVMEALRPAADRAVLAMMDTGLGVPYRNDGAPAYLDRRFFQETSEGVCRLVPPVTHLLVTEVISAVAPLAGKHAQLVASKLASSGGRKLRTAHHAAHDRMAQTGQRRPPKPAARLRQGLETAAVLPDHVWEAVADLIPPELPRPDRRHKSPRADARAILAGIICHEDVGVSWRSIPPSWGIAGETCRRYLLSWQRQGIWPEIRTAMTRARAGASGLELCDERAAPAQDGQLPLSGQVLDGTPDREPGDSVLSG